MRNYFVLDGKPSSDFDCWVASSTAFDGAECDIESVSVPGRMGELILNNNRFNTAEYKVKAYVRHNMQTNVPNLKAWLQAHGTAEYRYEEAIRPSEYMKARFNSAFTVDVSDRLGASMELTFIRDPRRFLKIGENPIEITSSKAMFNPTLYESKPFIRAYGTGTITIGNNALTVTSADEYTDIDCERMDAYKGSTNCNSNITLSNGEFPSLPVGAFDIAITGFSKIIVTPNWWTI